jgi:ClpP class serine protease
MFYIGSEAKDLGLVDELGGKDEAISYIENKTGITAEVVAYQQPKGLLSALSGAMNEKFFYIGKGIGNSIFTNAKLDKSISIST